MILRYTTSAALPQVAIPSCGMLSGIHRRFQAQSALFQNYHWSSILVVSTRIVKKHFREKSHQILQFDVHEPNFDCSQQPPEATSRVTPFVKPCKQREGNECSTATTRPNIYCSGHQLDDTLHAPCSLVNITLPLVTFASSSLMAALHKYTSCTAVNASYHVRVI